MLTMAQDLTRRSGGDVAGARVPTRGPDRAPAIEAVVDAVMTRWGLPELIDDVVAAVRYLLDDVRSDEPRVSLRLTMRPGVIRVEVGEEWAIVPIVATAA